MPICLFDDASVRRPFSLAPDRLAPWGGFAARRWPPPLFEFATVMLSLSVALALVVHALVLTPA